MRTGRPEIALHADGKRAATKSIRWRTVATRFARAHLHFIPASASWLNLVEVWFTHLKKERIRNQQAGPFMWTAPAERILESHEVPSFSESLH